MPNYKSNNFFVEGGKLHLPGVDESFVRVTPDGLFCVYDVLKVHGVKNPRQKWTDLLNRLPEVASFVFFFQFSGRGQRKIPVATKKNMEKILRLAKVGLEDAIVSDFYFPRTETQVLSVLFAAFPDANPCPQFFCCGYRIDLYLSKHRIAIECDEDGHQHYCPKKEAKRERAIKAALGCSFVRFNPYDADFNVGSVIFSIRQLINEAGRNDQHRHLA